MKHTIVAYSIFLLLALNMGFSHAHKNEVHPVVPLEELGVTENNAAIENGRSIYYTGVSLYSGMVAHTDGPDWLTEEDNHTCVVCHGDNGEGDELDDERMKVVAPDIRYATLKNAQYCHEGHEGIHITYTDAFIKRAIVDGLNPIDKSLSKDMPKYIMSEQDVDDLLQFLKTLK